MKMVYKLLNNGSGVILTRQPEIAESALFVHFTGVPTNATAIFTLESGESYYRPLSDASCSLPVANLRGAIKVTVAVLDKTPLRRWICEEFKADKLKEGTLIAPNDMNLPQTVVDLRLENEDLRLTCRKLEEMYKEISDKLEKIMEGYDFT